MRLFINKAATEMVVIKLETEMKQIRVCNSLWLNLRVETMQISLAFVFFFFF